MGIKKRAVGKYKRSNHEEQKSNIKQVSLSDRNIEFFKFLLRHTWNLFRLSPLYNIDYTEVKLKYYASCIKQALVENIRDTSSNIIFNVKINITEVDVMNSPTKTLIFEIAQKKNENEEQVKYRSIMFCFEDEKLDYNLTHAPLLLCAGTISISHIVHATLQECFSTVVQSFKLSQDNLMRLSLLRNFNKKKEKIEYTYIIPQISKRSLIKVSLESTDLGDLWNNSISSNSEETFDEVDKFYKCLNRELTNIYDLNFDKLNIFKIVKSDVTLHSDGKIKFHLEKNSIKVIDYIIGIAIILNKGQAGMP